MNTEPIRLGIVGLGRAGWGMHCPELRDKQDKFRIVAACDLIPERRERMASRYGCRVYEGLEDLLSDPEVEVVDVATRSCDHFQHASQALAAGKHVFVEKPMCCTYAEAVELTKRADAAGRQLYVRHNRRFEPAFQHIREIIASGILGDVYEIKLRRVSYSRRDDWQTLMAYGGGQLLNWGPHIIDHGLRLLESPLAHIWSDLRLVAAVGDAEDHLKIILTGENGRVVDLEISGGAALPEPEYLIWGSKGALKCTGNTIHLRYLDPNKPLPERTANPGTPAEGFGSLERLEWIEETIEARPQGKAGMDWIWHELYAAIREEKPFPITREEALQVMYVVSEVKKGTPFNPAR